MIRRTIEKKLAPPVLLVSSSRKMRFESIMILVSKTPFLDGGRKLVEPQHSSPPPEEEEGGGWIAE
jgi:hypothetical protein